MSKKPMYVKHRDIERTKLEIRTAPDGTVYEIEKGAEDNRGGRITGWRTESRIVTYRMTVERFRELAEIEK